ncbi:hypothetical protein [Bosea sp. PAMC 26642]|uniref:RraA family protein n=1 Tax=Bosea sp. (strain PAMC 26642) TaxID=1792307 RepID=UPI00076FF3DE|nr:hypothetical protein [Bosea sp. PAMC 26642]AMJ61616.1 hypothetical protein AXW83_16030 [Bosea sp. PAMC 26642]
MQGEITPRRATTLQICAAFGPHARIMPLMQSYASSTPFSGPATIFLPRTGRAMLNTVLGRDCAHHVVIIDGRNLGTNGIVGPEEAESAAKGKCRALIVFGNVYGVGKLADKKLPILASQNSPRVLSAIGGRVDTAYLDCDAGLITNEFYITGDDDGIVAIRTDKMQEHFPVP